MLDDDTPVIRTDDPMYKLLRAGKVREFNERRATGEACDPTRCELRGLDLLGLVADGLELSNSYLRQADLRGVDLTITRLEGASIHAAKISGAYFPKELEAEEIRLSLEHGIRLRCR